MRTLQSLLDDGTPLNVIYAFALSLSWPDLQPTVRQKRIPAQWAGELRDFLVASDLDAPWRKEIETAVSVDGINAWTHTASWTQSASLADPTRSLEDRAR